MGLQKGYGVKAVGLGQDPMRYQYFGKNQRDRSLKSERNGGRVTGSDTTEEKTYFFLFSHTTFLKVTEKTYCIIS